LRTDAASRFEKGTDISQTVTVLIRAAKLISEIAGGTLSSGMLDCYPNPQPGKQVTLSYTYLQKLSGKIYSAESVKKILASLGFSIQSSTEESLTVIVPYFKPDILIPADIVEEIMRVDGLDHIQIPSSIRISPSPSKDQRKYVLREKLSNDLVGMGFFEIFTNSIGNSNFYSADELSRSVKMINSLSAELDMLRLDMLPGGLQVIAHNLNRKNLQLRFFEFGKTYSRSEDHHFLEENNLVIYVSGTAINTDWAHKAKDADFFYLKGLIEKLLGITGLSGFSFQATPDNQLDQAVLISSRDVVFGKMGEVSATLRKKFDAKQPVFYAKLNWDKLMNIKTDQVQYQEIIKFPSVNRDLALLVDKNVSYLQVEQIALSGKINQLKSIDLFDVFESEKLGAGKKSLAVSFTFQDEQKTLTDVEIDQYMNQLVQQYQTQLKAEIRK
jgi:phenylalanyl-tRNA synthetase beta chain